MKHLLAATTLLGLASCVAPVDTRGVDTQLAGRCKLVAYQTDQQNASAVRHGIIGAIIVQDNENKRRQEIFDACIQAGGAP